MKIIGYGVLYRHKFGDEEFSKWELWPYSKIYTKLQIKDTLNSLRRDYNKLSEVNKLFYQFKPTELLSDYE